MNRPVRILFYAINGTGLGHLSRLLNIARSARDLLEAQGLQADFHFLTTSEAAEKAWDFPVYKLPSRHLVNHCSTPNSSYRSTAKFLISNIVSSIKPDILVMDTAIEGSFKEFSFIADYARSLVYINRHQNEERVQSPLFQAHLPLYDLILVPAKKAESENGHGLNEALMTKTVFCDAVHSLRREDMLTRQAFEEEFGIDSDRKVIYLSAGGGGDAGAEEDLELIISTLSADLQNLLIVGYGPLYRGRKIYRSNVIPYCNSDVSRLFHAVDFAVSACGYNTYQELLAAGVPTIFYAQSKGYDLQGERASSGAASGWNLYLEELTESNIVSCFTQLEESSEQMRDRLRERGVPAGALNAAGEILKLHSSAAASAVQRPLLKAAALLRRRWELCSDIAGRDFSPAAYHLLNWHKLSLSSYRYENYIEQIIGGETRFIAADIAWGLLLADLEKASSLSRPGFEKLLVSLQKCCVEAAQLRDLFTALDSQSGPSSWPLIFTALRQLPAAEERLGLLKELLRQLEEQELAAENIEPRLLLNLISKGHHE